MLEVTQASAEHRRLTAVLTTIAVVLVLAEAAHAQSTQVNLSSAFNVSGIVNDGSSFSSGGLDGSGAAYSANQLGSSRSVGGIPFGFGPANAPDAVSNTTITLPAGHFAALSILATGVNGNQAAQAFKVTYSDGSSTTFTQSLSDWFSPQGHSGESVAAAMTRRNSSNGTADNRAFNLYAYTFLLDAGKTVQSLKLPGTRSVVVLAATLVGAGGGTPIVQIYQHCDFAGWAASFTGTGSFDTAAITSRQGVDNDASAIKVAAGYKVTLYDGNNQSGNSVVLSAGDSACLVNQGFNDVLSSLKIEVDSSPDIDNSVVPCGNANGTVPYVRVHLKRNVDYVCVEQGFWNAGNNAAAIRRFFDFFDLIVPELTDLFSFTPAGRPFLIQITPPTGGACACVDSGLGSNRGVMVTGDAYPGSFTSVTGISVPGFWGYLLTLHEFINVWTGEMTSGWPTDWWADHRSPFPNAMDEVIMRDIGQRTSNQTLLNAATAQHERYTTSERDPEVLMFLAFFSRFGGFPTYNRVFSLVRGDGVQWDTVSPANPSALRTEYVIAYLQLGFRTTADLTQSDFVTSGVSRATPQDAAYTISATNVGDIADAHCSIASARNGGTSVNAFLDKLRHGDFHGARVASAPCGSTCPAECGCNTQTNQCVAPWRSR